MGEGCGVRNVALGDLGFRSSRVKGLGEESLNTETAHITLMM